MSASHYALLALLLYTLFNIVLDRYFSRVHPLFTMSIYCSVILILTLCSLAYIMTQSYDSVDISPPTGKEATIIALSGIICFIADICFFRAYNKGGSIASITTIVALMPVFATLLKSILEIKMPSITQLTGCILASISVYLVTRG